MQRDLVWRITKTLKETGLPPEQLCLEITESALMKDTPLTNDMLHQLKRLGVQLAVDDFGTGYSSLNYLRRMPADALKIDRSFVSDLDRDTRLASIVEAVVGLGNALGMRLIAEGIETAPQLQMLAAIGCRFGQGFYLARPQDGAATRKLVAEGGFPAAVRGVAKAS